MGEIKKATINLLNFQVTQCNLKCDLTFINPARPTQSNVKFTLTHSPFAVDEDRNVFIIEFQLVMAVEEKGFHLDLTFKTLFRSDTVVDEDFLNSQFVRLNAPAIAFPFLRSFVSTLTLNAGYGTVILPAINFAQSKFQPSQVTPSSSSASPEPLP